jgi:hypothetical protein
LNGLCRDAIAYFIGEAAYRADHTIDHLEAFLGPCEMWRNRLALDRSTALTQMIALNKLFSDRRQSVQPTTYRWREFACDIASRVPVLVLGRKWNWIRHWSDLQRCKLQWLFGGNDERRLDGKFAELWRALASYGLAHWLANADTALDVPSEQTSGLHAREIYQDQSFQWSERTACIRFRVPVGTYRFTMRVLPLRGSIAQLPICFLFNRRQVPRDQIKFDAETVQITISQASFRSTKFANIEIAIVCEPWDIPNDVRKIGIAIRDFKLERVSSQEQPVARLAAA